ncbi:hypothetical protein [Mesorhizobium sp. M0587]|uniref:hypothetical protein n=1 Tax=Mesorhizobium sp. M0587 TaxID=2956964 RepID=UPI00333A3545
MPTFRFEFIGGMPMPAIFANIADREVAFREAKRVAAGYLIATLGFQDLIAASKGSEQYKEADEPGVIRSG